MYTFDDSRGPRHPVLHILSRKVKNADVLKIQDGWIAATKMARESSSRSQMRSLFILSLVFGVVCDVDVYGFQQAAKGVSFRAQAIHRSQLQYGGGRREWTIFLPPTSRQHVSAPLQVSTNSLTDVEKPEPIPSRLDLWLSRLTTAFPLFVTGAAGLGAWKPATLAWANHSTTLMLAAVMMGTGLTLDAEDFVNVLGEHRWAVPLGVACQFGIMPAAAWTVSRVVLGGTAGMMSPTLTSALTMGLVLVGCSPGGTASNLVALIAEANVALSVILTTCSTLLAVVLTPLLVKLLLSGSAMGATIQVSGLQLCSATAKVVLVPVILGMLVQVKAPRLARAASRWTPFGSVLLVSVICGGVVAETIPLLVGSTEILSSLLLSVLSLHSIGFAAGYIIPRFFFPERFARTISIEVGMQNSALAVVLARSVAGAHPAASLPGALSATVHSCLGSILAAVWRCRRSAPTQAGSPSAPSLED